MPVLSWPLPACMVQESWEMRICKLARCQGKKGIKRHSIPCQYHVLHKDPRLSVCGKGDMQVVTYQLCHMYARGDKTVSYASPAYPADHCAERGKLYLEMQHGDPGEATELVNQ